MNLNKLGEFFIPSDVTDKIHIIGCGAMGSTLAELLTRVGLTNFVLYDFDKVTPHNISNQMFRHGDIGEPKVRALTEIITDINPLHKVEVRPEGWAPGTKLDGYVFLCVDDIELRKQIVTENKYNPRIKAFFDFRMRLTDAQHYACDWQGGNKEAFLKTMQFTHEEAKVATPVSACGTTLSVAPTVRTIVSYGVSNLINFIKGNPIHHMILIDAFHYMVDAYN